MIVCTIRLPKFSDSDKYLYRLPQLHRPFDKPPVNLGNFPGNKLHHGD